MDERFRRTLAILSCLLVVTSTFAPAVAARTVPASGTSWTGAAAGDTVDSGVAADMNPGKNGENGTQKGKNSGEKGKDGGKKGGEGKKGENGQKEKKGENSKKGEGKSGNGKKHGGGSATNPGAGSGKPRDPGGSSSPGGPPVDAPGSSAGRDDGGENAGRPSAPGQSRAAGTARGPPDLRTLLPDQARGKALGRQRAANNSTGGALKVDIDWNGSALSHRRDARSLLRETDSGNGGQTARHLARIEGTFDHVLDENRVTAVAVFRADKQVAAPLSRRAPNVSAHLLASDAKLAAQAVDDAERTRRVLAERNVSFDEENVSEELEAARRALERGERTRERSLLGAMPQYRSAWVHAQRAIDLMDEAVDPTVTVEAGPDLPHDGDLRYPVNGTVFDVRPYELEATLSVDDESHDLALERSTTPATTVAFNRTVTLGPQTVNDSQGYELTATVRDPGTDLGDDDPGVHRPQRGSARILHDGDGLPGWYERDVAGTDPLDPDSDSAHTNASEADDGVPDGAEDFDADGLATVYERTSGTDPFVADTDADGLNDAVEATFERYGPLVADSDDDGTADGREDPDGDGLSNAAEVTNGTALLRTDTDGDGLTDGEEVVDHATDPLQVDTDGDGLSDAHELELGTDPLRADTDGDGVRDGDETFTSETANEAAGASLSVTGEGHAASNVTIRNDSRVQFRPDNATVAPAGNAVELSTEGELESGTLTLDYNGSKVDDESDLSMFRFDDERQTFEKLESSVDAGADTVSAEVDRSSTFTVLEESTWDEAHPDELPSKWGVEVEEFDSLEDDCSGACHSDGDTIVVGQSSTSALDANGTRIASGGTVKFSTRDGDRSDTPTSLNGDATDSDGTDSFNTSSVIGDPCIRSMSAECYDPGYFDDDDGDGVINGEDDCPGTYGEGPDGCPVATPTPTPEPEEPEDPDVSTSLVTEVDLDDDLDSVTFSGQVSSTVDEGTTARIVAVGEDGDRTVIYSFHSSDGEQSDETSVIEDLSQYIGETVTIQFELTGTGGISLAEWDITKGSGGGGGGGSEPARASLPVRTVTLDDSGSASLEIDVRGAVADADSVARVVAVTDSGESKELFAVRSSGGPEEAEWQTAYADLSEFSGQTVTVRIETVGRASVAFDALRINEDSDGDGLTDAQEVNGFRTAWGYKVYTDPNSADTDGDGLSDSEELGDRVEGYFWDHYTMSSDPNDPDMDADGLDDYEELRVWDTEVDDADTDDDGHTDMVDERPHVEDLPPATVFRVYNNHAVQVFVKDQSEIESVEVTGYYKLQYYDEETESFDVKYGWREAPGLLNNGGEITPGWHSYAFEVDLNCAPEDCGPGHMRSYLEPAMVRHYYVNVTDENGNEASYLVDVPDNATREERKELWADALMSMGGGSGTQSGFHPMTEYLITYGFDYYSKLKETAEADVQSRSDRHKLIDVGPVPHTGTERTYTVNPGPATLELPNGEVYWEDGYRRGFGWEYIEATTALSDSWRLGTPIENWNRIESGDEYDYLIVDDPNGDGEIALWLQDDTIVAASDADEIPG